MNKPIVVQLQDGPTGPTVAQRGTLTDSLGQGMFIVELNFPALHKQFMNAAQLSTFLLFDDVAQFTHFMNVVTPPAPSAPASVEEKKEELVVLPEFVDPSDPRN